MGLNAGFEYIDNEWEISSPGIGPEQDWMISVADLTECFITIRTPNGEEHEYWFGANPTMVWDVDPAEVPDHDEAAFIDFFDQRYPGKRDEIQTFVTTYRVLSTDTEDKYKPENHAGDDLVEEWCQTLGLPHPWENTDD